MIVRYTRPEMAEVWTNMARFSAMLEVELAVADVQAKRGLIPESAAKNLRKLAKIDVAEIEKIEVTTKHDVIAFVSQVAASVGEDGRFLHFGLTSSDVLDTALSLQVRRAAEVLDNSLGKFEAALIEVIKGHEHTLCAGRTHGMHAEPTSFGVKMAGHLTELRRSRRRFQRAVQQMQVGKLSGAVGTFSALGPEIEADVCTQLKLKAEPVATQVIPRDRHAELFCSMALLGGGIERLAIELRHLQRTEVGEVKEGFAKGQKGSSAMPHKRNPISAENLTGAARLLRGYLSPALEDMALWHERDISHSSVERVILPDAFILLDYAVDRMAKVLKNLEVDEERMRQNLDLSQGQLFSSHLLLALVQGGMTREAAYVVAQELSHSLKPGEHLKEKALGDARVQKHVKATEVEAIFSGESHRKNWSALVARALKDETGGWL